MSLIIDSFHLPSRQKWEGVLREVPHSYYHTWGYCNAMQKSQEDQIEMLHIKLNDAGVVVIYCKRSKNGMHYDIYSPYGFGGILFWGGNSEIINFHFNQWMIENNIITAYLMSHPLIGDLSTSLFISNRTAYVIDLTKSEEELWSELGSGHKYELKKLSKDSSVSVTFDKNEIMDVFLLLYRDTLTRVGAGSSYYFSEDTLRDLTFDDNTLVIGGKINNSIHAIVMINFVNDTAEYFINATDLEGRNLTRLMLWEVMKILKAKNIRQFNLGGGASEGDQLEAFKRRLGGMKISIPIYRSIIDSTHYNKLCMEYGKVPDDFSYFPAYWKR